MHFLLLSLACLGPQEPSTEVAPRPSPESAVVEFQLDNGWRFLLVPRAGAPVVAIETAIDVGSVDDGLGKRGLANLLAQLTLQGSERLGSTDWSEERVALAAVEEGHRRWRDALERGDEEQARLAQGAFELAREHARGFASRESFRRFLEDAGGGPTSTVETCPDWTRYAVSLPSNQLELWCWLEAERFTRPCLRGFFDERERWVEARRRELGSAPLATLLDQLRLAALTTHPYRHPVGGYVEDLSKLDRAAAEDFFRKRYGADHMVTTMVGDLQPDRLRPLLERYLSGVPANPDAGRKGEAEVPEPQPTLGRRIVVSYAAPRQLALAWSAPPFLHTDAPAVEITARLLAGSPGSRLQRRLVVEQALARDLEVRVGWPAARSENLVLVTLTPLIGVDPAEIERIVEEELTSLRESGPRPGELAALQGMLRAERERALQRPVDLARLLNEHQMLAGDWRAAFHRPDQWDAVTADSVQAVVDVYFTEVRRTIAVLEPSEGARR